MLTNDSTVLKESLRLMNQIQKTNLINLKMTPWTTPCATLQSGAWSPLTIAHPTHGGNDYRKTARFRQSIHFSITHVLFVDHVHSRAGVDNKFSLLKLDLMQASTFWRWEECCSFMLFEFQHMFGQLPRCFAGTLLLPFCRVVRRILKFRSVKAELMRFAKYVREFHALDWFLPWTSLICVSSTKCVYMCVRRCPPPKHQMRLYVCHQMRLYVCHQMRLYVCHQMRLYVCHQMRLYVCHQMRLLNPQRSSLRSLTFARFARTFFNTLN